MPEPGRPATEYVRALTGLRGVAALAVFLFHYGFFNPQIRLDLTVPVIGPALQFPLGVGFAGVDLFFVLSGFLLTLPFAWNMLTGQPHPALGRYALRRLLRVFPAYYAQLAIMLLVGAWFVAWHPLGGRALLAHALMFFNLGPHPVRPMVGIWWTLPVELSFYLVLPLLALWMRPASWRVVLGLGILISLVYRLFVLYHFGGRGEQAVVMAASQLPGTLPEFLFGASAAIWTCHRQLAGRPALSPLTLNLMLIGGGAVAAAWLQWVVLPNGYIYWQGHWSMLVGPLVLGLALALIVVSLHGGSPIGQWLLANRPVYALGLISYSFYLWHFVVLQQLEAGSAGWYAGMAEWPRFLLSLGAVTAVAALSYALFERPFQVWSARQKKRRAQTVRGGNQDSS